VSHRSPAWIIILYHYYWVVQIIPNVTSEHLFHWALDPFGVSSSSFEYFWSFMVLGSLCSYPVLPLTWECTDEEPLAVIGHPQLSWAGFPQSSLSLRNLPSQAPYPPAPSSSLGLTVQQCAQHLHSDLTLTQWTPVHVKDQLCTPKSIGWSCNSQCLRIGLCLETRPLKIHWR
jgi:hypothetical protein